MAVKNMAASVLTRLKNQAKADKISFQMVLQLFAQEEFSEALVRLENFLKPVYESILNGTDWTASWICEEQRWSEQ